MVVKHPISSKEIQSLDRFNKKLFFPFGFSIEQLDRYWMKPFSCSLFCLKLEIFF